MSMPYSIASTQDEMKSWVPEHMMIEYQKFL